MLHVASAVMENEQFAPAFACADHLSKAAVFVLPSDSLKILSFHNTAVLAFPASYSATEYGQRPESGTGRKICMFMVTQCCASIHQTFCQHDLDHDMACVTIFLIRYRELLCISSAYVNGRRVACKSESHLPDVWTCVKPKSQPSRLHVSPSDIVSDARRGWHDWLFKDCTLCCLALSGIARNDSLTRSSKCFCDKAVNIQSGYWQA